MLDSFTRSADVYQNWVRMYERTYDDFFNYVPMASPMRSMMEPAKNAAKISDMFVNISNIWMRPFFGSESRA